MIHSASFWLGLTVICIAVQSFFSMMEMACVSFHRIRLQYYVNAGDVRAKWLSALLSNPSRLFGTTLIGVNVALQVGSECSRLFYSAVDLPPALAPLSQVFLVLIFGELAPMFAARRYAEHVAFLGIPVVYAASKVLAPITWSFGIISKLVNSLLGSGKSGNDIFITREELQRVFEDEEDSGIGTGTEDYGTVVSNIFSLRDKTAGQTMDPLSTIAMLPSDATVGQLRDLLHQAPEYPCIPLYHRTRRNIVGIAYPRDLLRIPDEHQLIEHVRSPWFLIRTTGILRVLKQFRQNKQNVAVVLSDKGSAIGVLTLDGIVSEIFGKVDIQPSTDLTLPETSRRHVERSFPGNLLITDFNAQYDASIPAKEHTTLFGLLTHHLGHEPEVGESIRVGEHELRVEESPLIGAKKVLVRTLTR